MKMMMFKMEVGVMKITCSCNRLAYTFDDCPTLRISLAQAPAPKRPGAQTSCSGA